MKNRYSGPSIHLRYWCVTKNDLKRISDFLEDKFGKKQIEIRLETSSRKSKVYPGFREFSTDAETLLSLDEEIQDLEIEKTVLDKVRRQSIWIEINFRFNFASFNIYAEDETGDLKGWVQNSYDELQGLVNELKVPHEFEEILRRDFQTRYPERRLASQGVVVLDYDGNITSRVKEEMMMGKKRDVLIVPEDWYRDKWLVSILLILGLLLLANIIRLWF